MDSFTGSLLIRPTLVATKSTGVTAALRLPVAANLLPKFALAYGASGAGNVNLVYYRKLALAGSAQTIDLTSLTDPFGDAVNFARLRYVAILNWATNDAHVCTIGGGTNAWAAAWGSTMVVPPGATIAGTTVPGVVELVAMNTTGFASIDGTHKNIKADPGANTFGLDILLAGSSA